MSASTTSTQLSSPYGIAGTSDPVQQGASLPAPHAASLWSDAAEYLTDAAQRTILFWDVMRQRGNQYHEEQKRTAPNVLSFGSELVMDGSGLPRPVNYSLVRIVPPQNIERARQLLAAAQGLAPKRDAEADSETKTPLPARRCPGCGGRMVIIETFEGVRPAQSPPPSRIRIDTS